MNAAQSACASAWGLQRVQRWLLDHLCRRSFFRADSGRGPGHPCRCVGVRPPRPAVPGVWLMQTAVTVINLIHDTATETDRPICHVIPGCSWREKQDTAKGDPRRVVHIRLAAPLWISGLSSLGKAPVRGKGRTLDTQAGRQAHLRRCPQPDRGRVCRPRENAHLLYGGGGFRQPRTAAAAFSW